MKVSIVTLGCKVNQFESQAMESLLLCAGHCLCTPDEPADAVIINTCTVTAESARKSRQAARQALAKNPDAIVAVCGCWPQINPEEANALGVHLVFGSGDRHGFLRELELACSGHAFDSKIDEPFHRRAFERLPAGALKGRTRAMLKIQDGCANFCTYCIIPYARGPVRSLPTAEAVSEAVRLQGLGIKELVITGIEISSYGWDLKDGSNLGSLITQVGKAVPDVRLRLGSLEPRIITEEFCGLLAGSGNLCEHFHLSLQSGCDETLRRMGRKYDTALFYSALKLLRATFPHSGLTADLIVGFPGETCNEFQKTLDFINTCSFSSMHIFPYSKRPGTPASDMKDQVPNSVKKERCEIASEAAEQLRVSYLTGCIHTVQSVLFESGKSGTETGHARNYCLVEAPGSGLTNQIRNVLITGMKNGHLFGEVSDEKI